MHDVSILRMGHFDNFGLNERTKAVFSGESPGPNYKAAVADDPYQMDRWPRFETVAARYEFDRYVGLGQIVAAQAASDTELSFLI